VDPNLANNVASATLTVRNVGFTDQPNLFFPTFSGFGGSVFVGQSEPVDITIGNEGAAEAHNPVLSLSLPDGVTASNLPPGCTQADAGLTCDGPALLVGSTWPVDLTLTATRAGSYTLHGVVSSQEQDMNSLDNAVDLSFDATQSPGAGADVAIGSVRFARSISHGTTDAISFVIANHGPQATGGSKFVATLPAGVSFASVSSPAAHRCAVTGRTITCSFASLSAGRTIPVTLTVTGNTAGLRTISLLAAGRASDPDSSDNAASVAIRIH
jgi:hypothetical protein